MVDIRERTAFESPVEPIEDVRVTFTSGNRDLPSGASIVSKESGLVFNRSSGIHIIEEVEAAGLVASYVVETKQMEAHPRPVARRKSAREIFEDSKARFPKIMARLAE